jgi:hypothetical protein
MKKKIALILYPIAAFAIASCAPTTTSVSSNSSPQTKTQKRAMTAAEKAALNAREDRVKAGKDWYVKRELGQNPGPMPHLSSLERELAYCDYKLKTTVDVDEIIHYMDRGIAIRETLKYDD